MKKEYYRVQIKLDYKNDNNLIILFEQAKNKQNVLRALYKYCAPYPDIEHRERILKLYENGHGIFDEIVRENLTYNDEV